jgi:hypothetical protein
MIIIILFIAIFTPKASLGRINVLFKKADKYLFAAHSQLRILLVCEVKNGFLAIRGLNHFLNPQ